MATALDEMNESEISSLDKDRTENCKDPQTPPAKSSLEKSTITLQYATSHGKRVQLSAPNPQPSLKKRQELADPPKTSGVLTRSQKRPKFGDASLGAPENTAL